MGGYYKEVESKFGGVIGGSSGTLMMILNLLWVMQRSVNKFPNFWANKWYWNIKRTGSAILKAEITALEKAWVWVETISNPKVFTLIINQPQLHKGKKFLTKQRAEGTTSTSFKEAALKLQVNTKYYW